MHLTHLVSIYWLFTKWTNAGDTKTSIAKMLAPKDSFISVRTDMNTNNQYSVIRAREVWREESIKTRVATEEGNIFWGTNDLWSRWWRMKGRVVQRHPMKNPGSLIIMLVWVGSWGQMLISLLRHSNGFGFILEETQMKGNHSRISNY